MNADDVKKAVTSGVLDAVSELAKMMARNEETEAGLIAAEQFEAGLRCFKDAHARALAVVDKVFPPDEKEPSQ